MTEQVSGPVSSPPDPEQSHVDPGPAVPPVVPGTHPSSPPRPPEDSTPRRRGCVWWTIGIVVGLAALLGLCVWSFVALFDETPKLGSLGVGGNVAVIRVDGVIAGTGSAYDGYVTPDDFMDQLDRAEEDSSVKAIVLRVDSPGGTVAASEEIAAYVKACPKPVIVSVGDVGASGAYMISSQSDEIWAMPGSAVGSIGVIAEIPNVTGLLDKVGVEFNVITAGEHKGTGSPYRPMTDEERALIQGEVDDAYTQFIDIVADGRGMQRGEVEKLATGWAWNGNKAQELGLVDKIGTYSDALDSAAKRGGIKGDYDITTYEEEFNNVLGALLGISRQLNSLSTLAPSRESSVRQALPR